MDYSDGFNRSSNFGIKQLGNDKVLIQIPFRSSSWEKEYNINEPINKILNDFKVENGIDIPDDYLKKLKINKNSLNVTDKIKIFLESDLMASYLVGKPFNNPFEVFIFNKNNKILNIQTFDNEQIKSMELNDYGASSAYCNGNNHLYISGGETCDNQIIDKFFDIDLKNNNIDGPYDISPKKNHSMVFIPPEKVFIVGGNDQKTFYFNTKQKQIIYLKDLNIMRTEPALQVIGNFLYCFDNVNKADNEQISFEKINIENPDAEWELIYPNINQAKFPQKFFAVSKDNKNENIIFLGGNMDDNMDSNELKNFKYNIEANLIEQTNIPFHDFNYKEKTFLTYNKNVDYLLPDFNRQHPEVTFYVKNKERFEKINYLPTEINENNNYIQKNKYNERNYDFNMPGIQSTNIETQIKTNMKNNFGYKNLNGIEEPDFNNIIDLQKNNIKINLEPTLNEPEIEPNIGDQQIVIDIPNQINGFNKGIKIDKMNINLSEEEKNSEYLPTLKEKLIYNNSFHLIKNPNNTIPTKYEFDKFHSSVNDPGNEIKPVKRSQINFEEEKLPENIGYGFNLLKPKEPTSINPEIPIIKGDIKIEGENDGGTMEPNIHMPKPGGIDLNDIKSQTGQKNIDIDVGLVNAKLNEKNNKIKGNLEIDADIEPKINKKKGIDTNIQGETMNIKGTDFKIKGEKPNLKIKNNIEAKQNLAFLEGGTIIGDKESHSKDKKFNLYGIITGTNDYKPNNINIDIPNIKHNGGEIEIDTPSIANPNLKIDGKIPNYQLEKQGININSGLNGPKISGKGPNIDIKSPGLNFPTPNINIETNGIENNIGLPNLDNQVEIKGQDLKSPEFEINEKDLNIKNLKINLQIDSNLPEVKANIPKVESKKAGIEINENLNVDFNKPKIGIKVDEKDMKIKGPNINVEGEVPKIPKPESGFNLTGIIPGNADLEGFNIKGSRRLYGSNMNIEIPDKNIKRPRLIIDPIDGDLKGSRRLDFNMNNNMNPGNINADINTLKLKTNLDMKGNIKGPKINDPKLNMDIKLPETKKPDINIKKDGIYEKITGIIPGLDAHSPKINVEIPKAEIGGNINGLGNVNIDKPNLNINGPKIEGDKNIDIKINKPDLNIPSGELNLKGPKVALPNYEMKGEIAGMDINKPKLDVQGGDLSVKGPKVDIPKIEKGNINGPNINIKGKLPEVKSPDLNIKGKKEFIMSGIIIGKKEIKKPKINVPGMSVDGNLKGPQIKIPNVDIKQPNLELGVKNKELELNNNIKDININGPELNIPSGKINLTGKTPNMDINAKIPDVDINKPNMDINAKIPGVDINKPEIDLNAKIPDVDINKPNIDINAKIPNIDMDINKPNIDINPKIPNVDMNIDKPNIDINPKIPNVDINKPEIDLNAEIPNVDINKPNVDINAKIPNLKLDKPKLDANYNLSGEIGGNIPNINSPRIDLPSGDLNLNGNIDGKDIKIPNVDVSVKKPDLKGINLNTNLPNVDINKNRNIKFEGEIKGNKPNIEIPKVDKEFKMSGIIQGYNSNDINIKGPRRMINIEPPEMNIKSSKLHLDQPDFNIKGSRRLDIPDPNLNLKGSRNLNTQINPPQINIPSGNVNIKGPNIYDPKLKDLDIKGGNINIDGKIPNIKPPDLNIKGKNEIIFDSGIIIGKKEIKKPKINVPGMSVDGNLKGPQIKIPNVDIKQPNLELGVKNKELELNNNIKDININGPELNIPSGKINLTGKTPNMDINAKIPDVDINKPNMDINAKIPGVDINKPEIDLNAKIPDVDINKPNIDINAKIPNIDMDINKPNIDINPKIPNVDMNIDKPNIDINPKIPNVDINKPEIDLNAEIPNVDINKPNVDINAKIPNLKLDKPKLDANYNLSGEIGGNIPNINSPRIDLPSGDLNLNGNIDGKDIKIPNVDVSVKKPDLKGINLNTNLPNVDINKNRNIKFEGEIKGNKPNIEIPKVDKEFKMSGIIQGYNSNDINIKGPRRMINIEPPEMNIKSSKLHLDQPDFNIKGSRRLDIPDPNLNLKGSRILYNTEINSKNKIPNNNVQLDVNSPKIEINSGNINLKHNKPEIKDGKNGVLITGIIEGDKTYSKNTKVNVNVPNFEIKGKLEQPNNLEKKELQSGVIPSSKNDKNVNIEIKNYNLLTDQNIDIKMPTANITNPSNDINNNIEVKLPEVDVNLNAKNNNEIISGLNIGNENNENVIDIELQKEENNLDSGKKEQNNNLFNININSNIGDNFASLEDSNIRSSQYAKKKNKGLPLVGKINTNFKASKIDVGGKFDANNIDVSNMKSANVGVGGEKMGERIIE